jgi:hypothetical protein
VGIEQISHLRVDASDPMTHAGVRRQGQGNQQGNVVVHRPTGGLPENVKKDGGAQRSNDGDVVADRLHTSSQKSRLL